MTSSSSDDSEDADEGSSSSASSSKKKSKKKSKSTKKSKKGEKKKKKKKSDKKSNKKNKKTKKDKKEPSGKFSLEAQEKARVKAQKKGMGNKRSAEEESLRAEFTAGSGDKKEVEEEPSKPYEDMTWPERAADAAWRAAKEAMAEGLNEKVVEARAEEAGSAIMHRAKQFGYQEPPPKKKFDASKGMAVAQKQLSPVEQVRAFGNPAVALRAGGGKGGGVFGMQAPMMSGRLEGGYM